MASPVAQCKMHRNGVVVLPALFAWLPVAHHAEHVGIPGGHGGFAGANHLDSPFAEGNGCQSGRGR